MGKSFLSRAGHFQTVSVITIVALGIVFISGAACSRLPLLSRWSSSSVDFSRDIRPILNQNCSSCHGGVRQKAGVSSSFREEALGKGKSGRPTVVPGDPGASELIKRVTSQDPETRMPYHAAPLSTAQISLLRRWIEGKLETLQVFNYTFNHPQDVCVDSVVSLYLPQWWSNQTYPMKLELVSGA